MVKDISHCRFLKPWHTFRLRKKYKGKLENKHNMTCELNSPEVVNPTLLYTLVVGMVFREKSVQEHVGASDAITAMGAIRKEKDSFKPKWSIPPDLHCLGDILGVEMTSSIAPAFVESVFFQALPVIVLN